MRRGTLRNSAWTVAAFGVAVALTACGSSDSGGNTPNGPAAPGASGTTSDPGTTPPTEAQQEQQLLDQRKVDYGEAARTAKLKLNDSLPTMDEINSISTAADLAAQKVAYEKLVDTWIAAPAFSNMMVKYFKDTFRTANTGAVQTGKPDYDKAALFAADVVVSGRPFGDILTATTNTCPTLDTTTGKFTDVACATTPTVGILTDQGIQAQYYSNMAFRRARFIIETFSCNKLPVEIGPNPVAMGNGTYMNPWSFDDLTGKKSAPSTFRIDFQDTSAVICANCHNTHNRIAPLFVDYDMNGVLQTTPQVEVPIPGNPKVKAPDDYLQPGAKLAWRFGKEVTDIASLGAAIAADPDTSKCAVNRIWNYAMSRGDIVNDVATVPDAVTAPYVTDFTGTNGSKLIETIRAVFKSDDFTKF